ncbi:MAG: hypothetical protein II575_14215, partial [Bacteroidales bacterium]|nr:hypothetical protein [Bacteroidales bacterium]
YEFQRIHSQASEDWDMPSNRFRNIWLAQDGNIYCKVDTQILVPVRLYIRNMNLLWMLKVQMFVL